MADDLPPGQRYVSKRERAAMRAATGGAALGSVAAASSDAAIAAAPAESMSLPPVLTPQVDGLAVATLAKDADAVSKRKREIPNAAPQRCTFRFAGHTGPVNCCRFHPAGERLLSASVDTYVKIWDAFGTGECLLNVSPHAAAVRDAQWNPDGSRFVSVSYAHCLDLIDSTTAQSVFTLKQEQGCTAARWLPGSSAVFAFAREEGGAAIADLRTRGVVTQMRGFVGMGQDIEFIRDGVELVLSADMVKRSGLDQMLTVWDVRTGAKVSNQLYLGLFNLPCLRRHPRGRKFVAQSSEGHISIFATEPPYKMNKSRHFEGHTLGGFRIQCSLSPDGTLVATGSADGRVLLFDWHTARTVRVLRAVHGGAVLGAETHPVHPSALATCGWDGGLAIWE